MASISPLFAVDLLIDSLPLLGLKVLVLLQPGHHLPQLVLLLIGRLGLPQLIIEPLDRVLPI